LTKVGYKMTEIGEIPEEWKISKLGDVAEIMSGGTPAKSKKEYWENGKIPWIKSGQCNDSLIQTADGYITELGLKHSSARLLNPGTVLVAMVGYRTAGRTGLLTSQACTNQNVAALIAKDSHSLLQKYLFYELQTKYPEFNKNTGFFITNLSFVRNLDILIPPYAEQEKIAEILSTADDEIQKVDEQITLTEQLKKGMMRKLLTRGIGHTKFRMTEIGEIPKEWDVKKIRELRQNIYYGITAKATKENTNLRMLRTTDIKNFKFDLNNLPFCQITEKRSDLSKYFLKRNDIIIARAGTVGVSILVEENLNNVLFGSYLIKIIFKQETIDMPFIHYYFQSQLYWNNISNAQGSTIKNINLPFLNSLEIPLPPIPEQQKIAEILSTVDNKLELLGTKRDKLNVLKKGLMNDLLTGKVRVKV